MLELLAAAASRERPAVSCHRARDLVGCLTGRRLSTSDAVRRYRADTQVAHACSGMTVFMPRHELQHAPAVLIRHHFAPNAASAALSGRGL